MAGKSIELQVRPRGKPIKSLPESVTVDDSASAADLHSLLAKRTRYSVHQLRVTKGSDGSLVPNVRDTTVQATGLRDQSTVYVKDLGPQIGWRNVFLIEYLGPILIHPLFYSLRPYIYSNAPVEASAAQTLVLYLVVLHFVKRELETLFVHRFSAATMPFLNVFKNSAHYWLLSGFNLAYWVYAPTSPAAKPVSPLLLNIGLALYIIGEIGNGYVHLVLRGLRTAGTAERNIPRGFLFNIVTCPNYMMETVTWIGVYVASGFSWSALLFLVFAIAPMAAWAKKKELRYRKEFGSKYKKHRYFMLPMIY